MAKKATGAAKVTLNDYIKKTSIGGNKKQMKKSSMNKSKKRRLGLNNG